jgi:hypothetical protein
MLQEQGKRAPSDHTPNYLETHTTDYRRTQPRGLDCQAETKDLWQSTLRAGALG